MYGSYPFILTGEVKDSIQPIVNEDHVLVFNGEIFNYRELASNHLGIASKEIKSDSDILFKLLNKFGERVISELDGQFALIFWNKKNRTGFAARDFLARNPLLPKNMAGIEFASLIKTYISQVQAILKLT